MVPTDIALIRKVANAMIPAQSPVMVPKVDPLLHTRNPLLTQRLLPSNLLTDNALKADINSAEQFSTCKRPPPSVKSSIKSIPSDSVVAQLPPPFVTPTKHVTFLDMKIDDDDDDVKLSELVGKSNDKPAGIGKTKSNAMISQSRRKNRQKTFKIDKSLEVRNGDQHVCAICGDTFELKSLLKRHMRSKHCNDTFNCHLCGRVFLRKCGLSSHINMHAKQKGCKCDICHKEFHDVSSMRRHQRMHTGVKGYACDICDKQFWRKDNLQDHIKKHHPSNAKVDDPMNNTPPPLVCNANSL